MTVLTRRDGADPVLQSAGIIPTDTPEIPAVEPVQPLEDQIAEALRNRPELQEARLQIENSHIGLKGSRNALLPELNLIATAQNSGLNGQSNAYAAAAGGGAGGGSNNLFSVGSEPDRAGRRGTRFVHFAAMGGAIPELFGAIALDGGGGTGRICESANGAGARWVRHSRTTTCPCDEAPIIRKWARPWADIRPCSCR